MAHSFRRTILLALFAATLAIGGSWRLQQNIRADARAELQQKLEAVLRTNHEGLTQRLAHYRSTARVWSATPRLVELSTALLQGSGDAATPGGSPARRVLRDWFRATEQTTGYRRFALIGPGNVVLCGTDPDIEGLHLPPSDQDEFLNRVWAGQSAFSVPGTTTAIKSSTSWLHVGTPVAGANGQVLAILAFSIDIEKDFGTLLQQGRTGRTGETYAFDQQARLLNRSRFEDQLVAAGLLPPGQSSVFRIVVRDPGIALGAGSPAPPDIESRPLTRMAASALAGATGIDLDGYRGYRGVPVIGTWLWDDELQVGIASEQDRDEAYLAVERTIRAIRIATVLLLLLLVSALLSYVLYRRSQEARFALESYRTHLEELVAERTVELERSNAELESYSYSIAHDLRQPLRGITSFSQILREEAGDRLSESERELLERISAAGMRMAELISAILEVASVTRCVLDPREVDFSALAERVCAKLVAEAPERRVTIRVEPGMRVRGDPELLKLALQELLENSWKFSANRDPAEITVGMRQEPTGCEFYIRDNGIGFDERFIDQLFRPFSRLHDDPSIPGVGTGLAIAKRVIERHGGSIRAEGTPGKGATFSFRLAGVDSTST